MEELIQLSRKAAKSWEGLDGYNQASILINALCNKLEVLQNENNKLIKENKKKHGYWIPYFDENNVMPGIYYKCSICGSMGYKAKYNGCPHCVSIMDLEGE